MMKAIAVVLALMTTAAAAAGPQDPPALPADAPIDPDVIALIGRRTAEVKARPSDAETRRILAMTFHANGLTEFAAHTYRQAITLDPSCARCWSNLAVIEADEHMNLQAAIDAADRAIAIDPRHVPIRIRRGIWLLDLGRLDDARNALEDALKLEPTSLAANVAYARVQLHAGDAAGAMARLESVARGNRNAGNDPLFRLTLGTAYARMGRAEHARAVLASVGLSPPSIADPWLDEVQAHRAGFRAIMTDASNLLAAGQYDRALEALERARRLRSTDNDVAVLTAQARMGKGDLSGAKAALEELLTRDPRSYDGMAVLASLHVAAGDHNAAMDLAQRAAALDPGRSQAWAILGHLHASAGRFAQAAETLGRAVHCGSQDLGVRIAHGRLLLHIGDLAAAQRVFEQLTFAQPFLGAAHVGLARALAERGEVQLASHMLERGRQLDPNDPLLADTTQRIAQLRGSSP